MMDNNLPRYRLLIIAGIFVIAAFIMIGKLYQMQILHGDEYSTQSSRKINHQFEIEAPRGNIYDANGELLAYNRECSDLYITKAYSSTEELNASLLLLARTLKENNEKYEQSFDKYVLRNPVVFNPDKSMEEIVAWQTDSELLAVPEKDVKRSAKELIQYIRDKFEISGDYSFDEAYDIICMRYEILKQRWTYITYGRVPIAEDVSLDTIAFVSENRHRIGGVSIQKRFVREYGELVPLVGHVLGYVGDISPEELEELPESGYESDDIIGKAGIEKYAEEYLKGVDGYREVEADIYGTVINVIDRVEEKSGSDVRLTIDTDLQATAIEAMKETINEIISKYDGETNFGDASAGATVVMDVKTGDVLAMASYPGYDPRWFISEDPESVEKRFDTIYDSYRTPLLNRAIQAIYTPGSTYKPIVATAALESEEHDYDAHSLIRCDGKWEYDGWTYYCLEYIDSNYWFTHKDLTISEGIKTSCNLIFHKLGIDVGIDKIDEWAEKFGLGDKTGIDLPWESEGIRSNRDYKYRVFDEKWWSADTGQSSIGQLYNNFTPMQMAVYTAALANGGRKLTPHVIDEILDSDGNTVYRSEPEYTQIDWSDETYEVIRAGMNSVTLDGTAKRVFDGFPISVAGKTGTAETGREAEESSNGIFICYAPVEDPEIAIVTVIENGVWGSYTAPVAKKILSAYFGLEE